MQRSGLPLAASIREMGMEELFEAKIALAGAFLLIAWKTSSLTSKFSNTASITKSESFRATAMSVENLISLFNLSQFSQGITGVMGLLKNPYFSQAAPYEALLKKVYFLPKFDKAL